MSAAQIMKGRMVRPEGKAGRPRQYGPVCTHCKAEPHHSVGLGKACYEKWRRCKGGVIQPSAPLWPESKRCTCGPCPAHGGK